MTESDLISQLRQLKDFKTDDKWLANNRELLLTQISNSGGAELSAWQSFIINFQSLAKISSRPAFALGIFVFLLISSSVFGHKLFSQAKPNDSLYIARIISEKAKLGTVLNTKERDRLAFQFAAGHAQDISTVLANPEFNNDSNQDQVAKLNESFEQEIKTVRNKISRLTLTSPEENNEDIVVMADSTSTAGRLEVSENQENKDTPLNLNQAPKIETDATTILSEILKASSSELVRVGQPNKADQILDEAKQSFEKKDYNQALDKLHEVQDIIKEGSK